MLRAILQLGLLGVLVVCVSILEAALPLMAPSLERVDRFRHSTHLEGTLAGWEACVRDGQASHPGKSRTYLESVCSAAYARQQYSKVSLTALTRHSAYMCVKDDAPFARGFSATLKNHSDNVQIARLSLLARLPNDGGKLRTANLPITLQPGEARHQCLGIAETFDAQADAAAFDALTNELKIEITGVYGMKKGDPKHVAAPSPFLLTSSNRR